MKEIKKLKNKIIMRSLVVLHYLVMLSIFLGVWYYFYRRPAHEGWFSTNSMAVGTLYALLVMVLLRIYRAYKVGLSRISELIYGQSLATFISLCFAYLLACILALKLLNPMPMVFALGLQILHAYLWTRMAHRVNFRLYAPKRSVVVYHEPRNLQKLEEMQYYTSRWDVQEQLRFPDDFSNQEGTAGRQGKAVALAEGLHKLEGFEVVIAVGVDIKVRNALARYCIQSNKEFYFVPQTDDVLVSGAEHIKSFSVPILRVRRAAPSPEYLLVKRLFDVFASLCGILLFSPLMLLTALAIKLYDGGPVFYKQVRLTKDAVHFNILKFRSMKVDAEKDREACLATKDDDRITPVGRIIRAIRIDELPQMFNILRGDMTLVGPRPERPELAEKYTKQYPAFNLRLQVKAGLTGYAQVYGKYNTKPSDKLKMDLMYINHMGLIEDLKLLFATVQILFMKGSTEGVALDQTTGLSVKNDRNARNYEVLE